MKHLSRELIDYLAGPPRIAQNEFARKIDMAESKLCRLLAGSLGCDRATLDQLLSGILQKDVRTRLVAAYFKDHASPAAIAHLHSDDTREDFTKAEASGLSPKGRAALRSLLQSPHVETLDDIVIDLAKGFNL